jgi:hypothetical protein
MTLNKLTNKKYLQITYMFMRSKVEVVFKRVNKNRNFKIIVIHYIFDYYI